MDNNLSRNYNVDDFKKEEDERFIICAKECVFTQGLYFTCTIIAFILAYTLSPDDVGSLQYIFGLPVWFAAATSMCALMFIVMLVFNLKVSKRFSLKPRAGIEEVDE